MILYPAGPEWTHTFDAAMAASEMAARVTNGHGFTRGTLFQPFGAGRGAVIAQRDHILLMALHTEGGHDWFSVAPSLALQQLLWSLSNGLTSQWSEPELKILTGCRTWPEVANLAGKQYAAAVRSVERALQGLPEAETPPVSAVLSEMPVDESGLLELPGNYMSYMQTDEELSCAR
ncbi:hypothetical protein [Cupriavidus basilensis]|uniref:hypothetical protein n=1 Tax=Cupriavidus basilensis TaxID=68895 RepID=UPI0020A655ED|nr:hypothetical protein [Cupriavidus basilensis]MCP3018189.1 hypothetical protein [Cupriavidus basilensis]